MASRADELLEAIRKRHARSPQERTFLRPVFRDCLDAMQGIEAEAERRVKKALAEVERMRRVADAAGYWRAHEEGAKAGELRARRELRAEVEAANRLRERLRGSVARLIVHSGELQGILWIVRELDVIVREEPSK